MSLFSEMSEEEFGSYCREVSVAYWAEEDEYAAGIHPEQVKERIEKELYKLGYQYEEVSFLDWASIEGPRVKVSKDGSFFGIFNYETNKFESIQYKKIRKEGIFKGGK